MTSTAAGNCCQNSEMSPEKCLAVCETLSENQQRDPWSAHSTREWGKGLQRPHKHTIWAAHPQAVRWQKPRDLGQAASPRALALLTNPGRISLWASGTAPPLEGLWGMSSSGPPRVACGPPLPCALPGRCHSSDSQRWHTHHFQQLWDLAAQLPPSSISVFLPPVAQVSPWIQTNLLAGGSSQKLLSLSLESLCAPHMPTSFALSNQLSAMGNRVSASSQDHWRNSPLWLRSYSQSHWTQATPQRSPEWAGDLGLLGLPSGSHL